MDEVLTVARKYRCPLFVWKTGKLLANIHTALSSKWEVRMQRMDEMVEIRISEGGESTPLTLNLNVTSGKALWGYIDLPVLHEQEALLKEVTKQLKTETEATVGPLKRRVKFKFEGEAFETETTTADIYSWSFNYGLRYNLDDVVRFLKALDSVVREHGGQPLEANEFFVTYRDGGLHLRDEDLSFILVTPSGYYSAFLHVGEETLELQICDEEETDFPTDEFDGIIQDMIARFDSDKDIILPDVE